MEESQKTKKQSKAKKKTQIIWTIAYLYDKGNTYHAKHVTIEYP